MKDEKKLVEPPTIDWIGWKRVGNSRELFFRKTKGDKVLEEAKIGGLQSTLVALERIRWEAARRIVK